MVSTIYALLIGIDNYHSPVTPLHGCVADIEAMHTFLASRVGGEDYRLDAVDLKDVQATRRAVVRNFLTRLGQAGPDDAALFYYCGHGSQARTAPEFFHLEPDRLDETLVCYDSRMPGNYDLADKEISKLIAEVAKKEPHIVVVLNSCHSGSATRNVESVGVRRVSTDKRQRPLSSYLITPSEFEALGQSRSVTEAKSGWTRLPKGKHVVLSACQSDEEPKEISIADQTRGVFSYFLMDTLQSATRLWTYRDLFARVNSLVRARLSRQSPLIKSTDFSDLDRPFLGGAVQNHAPYFTVSFDKAAGWLIDGGAIHVIPGVQGNESTYLALFPADANDLEAFAQALGDVCVQERQPTRSKVAITLYNGKKPDPDRTYKAVITALPVSALGFSLEGDEAAIKLVREALPKAGPGGGSSLLVREVAAGGDLRLVARHNRFLIQRAGDDRPLSAVVEGWSAEKADDAVEYLEHIARWLHVANLNNPVSRLPTKAVTMGLYLVGAGGMETPVDLAIRGADLQIFYEHRDEVWHEPEFKLKLTNNSNRRLYCILFDLTDRFKIWAENLLPGGGIWLDPKEEAWAYDGNPIPASVPDELWKNGMTEYKNLLKVVVSTESCEAARFQQGNLDVKYERYATRGRPVLNSLERLMQRAHTREIGDQWQRPERCADWMTTEVSITAVRPLEDPFLPPAEEYVSLAPQVTVLGHTKLRARARLTTVPLASRDIIQAPQLPVWLRDDPSHVQPFDLSPSRSVEAGLSVLELTEVSDFTTVTPEQPLILRVNTRLMPEDRVLPVSYDPQCDLYLPLGRASYTDGSVKIQIERLPSPSSSRRSLTSSIKVFFEKVICEKFGLGFDYPQLGTVDATGDYTSDLDEVRVRVDKTARILLYIHGIIGDTWEIGRSAFNPKPGMPVTPIGPQYDLILTFDYDNLKTSVQDNAQALKQRLQDVSLGANHDKTLHIAAHSMGGLVSRWFIEREGGSAVVQHLVMLGTPNEGSPWPTVKDWAIGAIGLGLNYLTTVGWPVKVLESLMLTFEQSTGTSLKQMEAGSQLLQDLAASPDPGVRYTIIAGNTSLIADALIKQEREPASRVKRLFKKLNLQRVLHSTASLAFFGTPNDVAVGVSSIASVPTFAKVDPPNEVACDHRTYFSTDVGLRALAEALT